MKDLTTIDHLLNSYYEGFARKSGWEDLISEDFKFMGGDMTQTEPIIGKSAYIQVINRFSQIFENMRIRQMIVDGDSACVIGNYDYRFPNGNKISGNVAEIWKAKNGKLDALTIYFDTLTFEKNTPK